MLQERIEVPCDAAGVPRASWFEALVGTGGQAQRRLLKGSGCHGVSLRTDTDEADLRVADKLYVQVKAPTAAAVACGAQRVRRAIADVLQAHGVAPTTPLQRPPPVAEPLFVPPAPSGPPPAWGAPAPPAPAMAGDALAEESCGVCMADVVANVRMEPCGHYACVTCVAGLRRRALFVSTAGVPCPYCRTVIARYDAPPGVDVGEQPAAAPETSLALRATLPPLEIRRPPPAAVTKASREAQAPVHPKYKTVLCTRWSATGTCQYASRCHFAHGEAEIRVVVRDPPRVDSRDFGAGFWTEGRPASPPRAASTPAGAGSSASSWRVEQAQPVAVPPEAAGPAQSAVVESPQNAAPEELPPAQSAAAPGFLSPLVPALGAQQPSRPAEPSTAAVIAVPLAMPAPASTAPGAAVAGTPWELILQLEESEM